MKMEIIKLDPKFKPLYANLLKLGITKYLISKNFKYLRIEKNIDQLWAEYQENIRNFASSNYRELALLFTDSDYAEETLKAFLMKLFLDGKEKFIEILGEILIDFAQWSSEEKDFNKIKKPLLDLGYHEEVLGPIFSKLKKELPSTEKIAKELAFSENKLAIDKTLCFVLMPLADEFIPIYNVIKEVVENSKLKCIRSDEISRPGIIIEDIYENIQKAFILIADLTGKNPNVFYELGFAHAIGKEVILITQNIEDVPFDVKHHRCITYENSISGAEQLRTGLSNTLKEILKIKM